MGGTTILIGFADALSAPEVLWSLVEADFRVVAFARQSTTPALLKSRFVTIEYITDPSVSVDGALSDLLRIIRRWDDPILMSLDDASLWLLRELKKSAPIRVAGAVGHQADVALDKRLQLEAAGVAGFHVPVTRIICTATDLAIPLEFPTIIKPALAAHKIDGSLGRGRSWTLADEGEFAAFASEWNAKEPMLAQPLINGVGEGLFGLALSDRVVCWSGHRRVRMMNPAGSGASACTNTVPTAEIQAIAERFLRAIEWRGMFMIELLRDENDRLWFIELNGRSWGSMALARRNGFEYPSWTIRSFLDSNFVPSQPAVRTTRICRHFGRELVHLAFVLRGPKSRASGGWPSRWESFRQVLRYQKDQDWYNYNRKDWGVFLADTGQTLVSELFRFRSRKSSSSLATRILNKLRGHRVRLQQSAIRASGKTTSLLNGSKSILFLCYGNINRSALAEQHLRQLLGSKARIASCGFHSPDQRPLDPTMNVLAAEYGILFPSWSSRRIDRKLVEDADLIFAMEARHLVRLYEEYPDTRGRAFLLSCITQPETIPLEIEDPHGRSTEAYRRCIREITFATTELSKQLETRKVS